MTAGPIEPTFLGLDLSTQSLKAIIISSGCRILHEHAVSFEHDLPHYNTIGGTVRGPNGQVTSPVEMWLEAFDLLFDRMKTADVDFSKIAAISGAGQVIHFFCDSRPQLCLHFFKATRLCLLVKRGL